MAVDYLVTNTDGGANLREQPNTTSPFRNLPFATALKLIEDTGSRWKFVETEAGERGFVSSVNLTIPASDAVVRLVKAAAHYWKLFDFGQGTEDKLPYRDFVVAMWTELGQGMPPKKTIIENGVAVEIFDTSHPDWPWSAAGMSAFIRRATGYDGFAFSLKHSKYIHQSIKNKNKPNAPFWGFQLSEAPIRVGDLVVQWRGTQQQTFSSASSSDDFKSHTDVVCDIKDTFLYAMGANNTKDTVTRKKYSIDANGHLVGPGGAFSSDNTVFMFMRNNAK